ncbi:hypothetical protein [Bacillus tianshenii]|nr:hypothetical protein [Bacillus tianshenii]
MKESFSNIQSQDEIIKVLQYAYQQGMERENISMMELVNEMREKLQMLIK